MKDVRIQNMASLPQFEFPTDDAVFVPQAERDLFSFVSREPQEVVNPPKPTVVKREPEKPDPRAAQLERARVNLANIRITGILSSQDGLTAIVDSPFFKGDARGGEELGEGIFLETIGADLVLVRHQELDIERSIVIE